jgi:hypothetical protein
VGELRPAGQGGLPSIRFRGNGQNRKFFNNFAMNQTATAAEKNATAAAGSSWSHQRILLVGCVLVAGFKLWLVGDDEIVAQANPLDQLRYLEMARALAHGQWLGGDDPLTLIREPGYPGWVAVIHGLGLPLRLATELFLVAAAYLFCTALLRAGASPALALVAYAVLVLEPHSLVVNRDALPAGFYLPLLLCALAGLVWSAHATRPARMLAHAGWCGLALGLLWATRPEKPLLLAAVAVFASFHLAAGLWRGDSRRAALRRSAVLVGVPLCGIALVAGGIAAINHRHYGIFATTGVRAPGYLAANRALLSIEHVAPTRFVPVPRDVRERAYRVSGALRELRPTLEGRSWARAVSCNIDGVCDDIGAGYFRWLLREAAAAAGHMASPAEADAFFRRIADDLEGACRTGELPCRRSSTSFLHPHPETYLPHLGSSLRRVLAKAFGGGNPHVWDAPRDHPATPLRTRRLFDEVANRRGERTGNGRVIVRGWAAAEQDPIQRAALHTTWGRHASQPGAGREGPAGLASEPVPFHFEIAKRTRAFAMAAPVLVFERESGATTKIPLSRAIHAPEIREGVQVTIDSFEETGHDGLPRRVARTALWIAHPLFYAAVSALGLLAAAALLLRFRSGRLADPALGVCLTLGVLVAARFALLVLVDSSSFPARSSRFVYPAVSLHGCAMLLLIEQGLRNLRSLRKGPRRRREAQRH